MARATRQRSAETPLLEWVLGAIGAALIGAAVVYLLLDGTNETGFGAVEMRIERIEALDKGYLVSFAAHNMGAAALADVHLRARVRQGARQVEEAQLTLDYLPGRSTRRGGFYLQHDPRVHQLEVRAEGFQEP